MRAAVGRGMVPVAAGLGVGLVAAALTTRLLDGLLYRVSASDPATFVAVALALGGVALAATWIPARRATRVDPVKALKAE